MKRKPKSRNQLILERHWERERERKEFLFPYLFFFVINVTIYNALRDDKSLYNRVVQFLLLHYLDDIQNSDKNFLFLEISFSLLLIKILFLPFMKMKIKEEIKNNIDINKDKYMRISLYIYIFILHFFYIFNFYNIYINLLFWVDILNKGCNCFFIT